MKKCEEIDVNGEDEGVIASGAVAHNQRNCPPIDEAEREGLDGEL